MGYAILIVTPAPRGSQKGNRITAQRWARLLRELGHRVEIADELGERKPDLLVALHALKSLPSVRRFRQTLPGRPLLVALTGTDVYRDLRLHAAAPEALAAPDRLIVLQPEAIPELPEAVRPRARVIYQSATAPEHAPAPAVDAFEVCVLGHLREVKDPFRAAEAVRLVPPESRLRVLQVGGALSPEMERRAREEEAVNPRYRWLGERPRPEALRILAGSRLLALTSLLEGGANVVTEALAASVPVVSSRISGSIGLLGPDYPGYFPVGDTAALARLLRRAETEPAFYEALRAGCRERQSLADPGRERRAWQALLAELSPPRQSSP